MVYFIRISLLLSLSLASITAQCMDRDIEEDHNNKKRALNLLAVIDFTSSFVSPFLHGLFLKENKNGNHQEKWWDFKATSFGSDTPQDICGISCELLASSCLTDDDIANFNLEKSAFTQYTPSSDSLSNSSFRYSKNNTAYYLFTQWYWAAWRAKFSFAIPHAAIIGAGLTVYAFPIFLAAAKTACNFGNGTILHSIYQAARSRWSVILGIGTITLGYAFHWIRNYKLQKKAARHRDDIYTILNDINRPLRDFSPIQVNKEEKTALCIKLDQSTFKEYHSAMLQYIGINREGIVGNKDDFIDKMHTWRTEEFYKHFNVNKTKKTLIHPYDYLLETGIMYLSNEEDAT